MKKNFLLLTVLILNAPAAFGSEPPQVMIEAAPLRYAFVEGDANKFREQNWMREGYAGGFEEFSLEPTGLPEEVNVSLDGHALIQDNDYEANVLVNKEGFGYVKLEYQEFSKFYDDTGGVYYPFATMSVNSLGRDLELQVGRLRVETGLMIEDMPHLIVAYERRFKDGAKSRLTWAPVVEGGVTKNIAPSFQTIDEIVDTVEITVSHDIKGVELQNTSEWEWSQAEMAREEKSLSATTTASAKKIRVQTQSPEAQVFTNTASAQRWFRDESVFAGGAYHLLHMTNSEVENIFEMNEGRVITNFSNPKQIRDAVANNDYDSHTWVTNFMFSPWKDFSVNANLRTEAVRKSGDSSYPSDTTPVAGGGAIPDGIINNTELSEVDDKVGRLGEGISLRYTGIPKTALYNEFEFEQTRNWLSEDRNSRAGQSAPSAGEIFRRETISYMNRGIWTIGGQFFPAYFANLTAHFRMNRSNSDYDDKDETFSTATGAKSAFFEALNIQSHEFSTRLTLKPKRWLRPSVRYQFQTRDYMSRVEDQTDVQTEMDFHIFTFDLTLQPRHNLLIVTGLSPQYGWVDTPSRHSPDGGAPRFQANNVTWVSNVNYDINEKVSFLSGLELSVADNFNDSTATGLPLEADYNQMNVSCGVRWALTKLVGLELEYAFYHYNANDLVDSGDYNANLIWLKTVFNWA